MQTDLLDAQASVDYGKSQFPTFQGHIREWQKSIQVIGKNSDSNPLNKEAIVRMKSIPGMVNAELGAIINSSRSVLDLLAAALAIRNGKRPSEDTHFPIFYSFHDFIDPKHGIESKKWLSPSDVKIIKALNPYGGGHEFIWPLHKLDIIRKHERLIRTVVKIGGLSILGRNIKIRELNEIHDETILFEYPRDVPQPEVNLFPDIIFSEISLPTIDRKPLFPTFGSLADSVSAIISLFDR